ncbi:hypothetical protein Taro_051032 [Colocasia esculenta]|uniref:Uncharacterized protein n=1 Tax=Colocasia esculenta TaxID=4460 RepID=A0A843XEX5_COLES|nr:hypothetical protein [Colocasia esculenta]
MSEMEMGMMQGILMPGSSLGATVAAEDDNLRKGPWTADEDLVLVNYISLHGEGRWNSLARAAGLKRSGKSCRLRWLNYLRPDVRRGNITPQEQILILQLHARWGNRWSKIAQQLPGRTDNEIKNYWRTRVQKHAKKLKCDVNSQQFKDAVQCLWIPLLLEKIHAGAGAGACEQSPCAADPCVILSPLTPESSMHHVVDAGVDRHSPDHSSTAGTSSDSSTPVSNLTDIWVGDELISNFTGSYIAGGGSNSAHCGDGLAEAQIGGGVYGETLLSPSEYLNQLGFPDFEQSGWGFSSESFWAADDSWFPQQQQLPQQ